MDEKEKSAAPLICFDTPLRKTAGALLIPVAGFLTAHPAECAPINSPLYACGPGMRHPDHMEGSETSMNAASIVPHVAAVSSLSSSDTAAYAIRGLALLK